VILPILLLESIFISAVRSLLQFLAEIGGVKKGDRINWRTDIEPAF
jgi:hypothetical protein